MAAAAAAATTAPLPHFTHRHYTQVLCTIVPHAWSARHLIPFIVYVVQMQADKKAAAFLSLSVNLVTTKAEEVEQRTMWEKDHAVS